jgi:Holliday junction resolvase RusA-like endonuclease
MLVAFHMRRKPVSLNAKPNPQYAEQIAARVRDCYAGPMLSYPLYSRIIWFHKYRSSQGDVDNIAKRIHDALKGVLFRMTVG